MNFLFPKDPKFFVLLQKQLSILKSATYLIIEYLREHPNYCRENASVLVEFKIDIPAFSSLLSELHKLEHESDDMEREIIRALSCSFITPIDKEDILKLTNLLDDAMDKIYKAMSYISVYNCPNIRTETFVFIEFINKGITYIEEMLYRIDHSSGKMDDLCSFIRTLEKEADVCLENEISRLVKNNDPIELFRWDKILQELEECINILDRIFSVGQFILIK